MLDDAARSRHKDVPGALWCQQSSLCLTVYRLQAGTLNHKDSQLLAQDAGKVERAERQLRHASSIRRVSHMIGQTFDGDDATIGNAAP